MRNLVVILSLLLGVFAIEAAEKPETMVARLIAESWAPQTVRVDWQFKGKVPELLAQYDDWKLADLRPTRMAGSMIIVLQHCDGSENVKVAISGIARVFGLSLMPIRRMTAGENVDTNSVVTAECEWTHLKSVVADLCDLRQPKIANRTLVPNRPITIIDLRTLPIVLRDQPVDLEYVEGAVRIRMSGRALQDGAVGETVAVAVDMGKTRRFEGIVIADGIVQIVR